MSDDADEIKRLAGGAQCVVNPLSGGPYGVESVHVNGHVRDGVAITLSIVTQGEGAIKAALALLRALES